MDLNAARALALDLMAEHGVTAPWTFEFDNAKSRMGACNYQRRRISISRYFTEHATEAQVRDTILHEIAHALTPGAHHGTRWKAVALRIGATPRSCGENPFFTSDGQVAERLAKVEGKPFYRVAAARDRGKRYRILTDNEKTYTLIDENGDVLRASKGLVYRDGDPEPTPTQMMQTERDTNLARAKGKPRVRVTIPGYEDKRYALLKAGRTSRQQHTLVNLDSGQLAKVSQRFVRPENVSERLGSRLLTG